MFRLNRSSKLNFLTFGDVWVGSDDVRTSVEKKYLEYQLRSVLQESVNHVQHRRVSTDDLSTQIASMRIIHYKISYT